jgi:iron complex transport system permease protein
VSDASGRISPALFHVLAVPVLLLAAVAGVVIGSTTLEWPMVVRVLAVKLLPAGWLDLPAITRADEAIVWLLRVPRVLVAALVGAGLATAGAIMQSLFRNPLAEPSLTGVGPGAVLGAVAVFVSGWGATSVVAVPLAAIGSALLALIFVYTIATRGGSTPITTLLLTGIAVGAFLTAMSSLLLSINIVTWQVAQEVVFWMMGGLDARTWAHVGIARRRRRAGQAAARRHVRHPDRRIGGGRRTGRVRRADRPARGAPAAGAGAPDAAAGQRDRRRGLRHPV